MNTNPHTKADPQTGWIAFADASPPVGVPLFVWGDTRGYGTAICGPANFPNGHQAFTHWRINDLPPPCPMRTQRDIDLEAYGKWTEELGRGPSGSCAWLAALAFERDQKASAHSKTFCDAISESDQMRVQRDQARAEASRLRRAIVAWWSVQGDRHKKGPVMSQVEEQNLLGICAETPPPWHTP